MPNVELEKLEESELEAAWFAVVGVGAACFVVGVGAACFVVGVGAALFVALFAAVFAVACCFNFIAASLRAACLGIVAVWS